MRYTRFITLFLTLSLLLSLFPIPAFALSTQAERTLESLIGPSGMIEQFTMKGRGVPAVSLTGQGRIYFDSTSNTFQVSQNGGVYVTLAGAGGSAPANATYILQTTHSSLASAQSLGALSTGLLLNTVAGSTGTLSAYGGAATCTNQFVTALNASGVSTCTTATLASAQYANQGTITTLLHGNAAGNPSFAAVSLTADVSGLLPLANGGLNATLTASNGGIFYSTATAGAMLSGTATALQMLQSGATAAPTWSTATWPATTTINQLLYSSAANTVAGLATVNNGLLLTSAAGVPSITACATTTSVLQGGTPPACTTTPTISGLTTFQTNPLITNTAPGLVFTNTTGAAKSLTIALPGGNIVDLRESAGASGSLLVLDLANNRVSIGTPLPLTMLHAVETSPGNQTRGILIAQHVSDASASEFIGRKSRSTAASPTIVANGDFGVVYMSEFYDGATYQQPAFFGFIANGTIAGGSVPTDLVIWTGASTGGRTEKMRITSAGNIGYNTTSFGTSLAKGISIGAGTAPTTSPAGVVQAWAANWNGAATAALFLRTEEGTQHVFGSNVGLGTTAPLASLSLGSAVQTNKLLIYDNGSTNKYGFGVASGVFQTYAPTSGRMDFGSYDGTTFSPKMTVDNNAGNVGIGTTVFGASLAGGLALGTGTAPTTSPAGIVQQWAANWNGAATAALFGRSEEGNVSTIFGSKWGINNTVPFTELTTASTGTGAIRGISSAQYNTGTQAALFDCRKARGTQASPTTIVTGDILCDHTAEGYEGTSYLLMAKISMISEGTIATTRVPTRIEFSTATDVAPSVLTLAMKIDSAQNVSVQQRLTSNGSLATPKKAIAFADSPYTVGGTDLFITCDATNGAVVINFPAVSAVPGRQLWVVKTDSSANNCTPTRAGADTFILGGTTDPLTVQGKSMIYASDGTSVWTKF